MWLLILFDISTLTLASRKQGAKFRKQLLKNGFKMLQYSVYNRQFANRGHAEVHIKRIKAILPEQGRVVILPIPNETYKNRQEFYGYNLKKNKELYKQLIIF